MNVTLPSVRAANDFFAVLQVEHIGWRRIDPRHYLEQLFQDVELNGKNVLDIGGGNGICSFYAAVRGAQRVICLEPSADGSNSKALKEYERLQSFMNLPQLTMRAETFQEFLFEPGQFDVVLLHNSINHLDEAACADLRSSASAQASYAHLFRKLFLLCAPNARLIICDCSRYNFFGQIGLRNPVAPTIEWDKHQSPQTWAKLVGNEGFGEPIIRWTSFLDVGIIEPLIANQLAAYFLGSHFCLTLKRLNR